MDATLFGGDAVNTPRGSMIASLLEELDLGLLDNGDPTHFNVQNNSTSVLDLCLCSSDALLDFTWKVTEDLCGSDHYPSLLSSPELISIARV